MLSLSVGERVLQAGMLVTLKASTGCPTKKLIKGRTQKGGARVSRPRHDKRTEPFLVFVPNTGSRQSELSCP